MRCPFKMKWSVVDGQCDKEEHLPADTAHHIQMGPTSITWLAGDRREFEGEWPGPCTRTKGCLLPLNHPKGCAV